MLNYVAFYLLGYLLGVNGFQRPNSNQAAVEVTHRIRAAAAPVRYNLHSGIILAILAARSRGGCCRARRWASR